MWKLIKIYWYTVEFGVVAERNASSGETEIKAFGAGILSSFGEMQNMARGVGVGVGVELRPFDPFEPLPKMSYKDGYQQRYYVLESFERGVDRMQEYCEHVLGKLDGGTRVAVEQIMRDHECSEHVKREMI